MKNEKIIILSKIFAQYKTYPISRYAPYSAVRRFQHLYPENHFSSQIEMFLSEHTYEPTQRGTDLPWWGSKYFMNEPGHRVMVVSQGTLANDAGSIVFLACLFPVVESEDEYKEFTQGLDGKNPFAFKSWEKIRQLLDSWKIDLQFCYITDASKVYKENSCKNFDKQRSKKLLETEIEFCSPNLIILLGERPLSLLDSRQNYARAVEAEKLLQLRDRNYVVAPFPIGNGPGGNNSKNGVGFEKRLKIASRLIDNSKSLNSFVEL